MPHDVPGRRCRGGFVGWVDEAHGTALRSNPPAHVHDACAVLLHGYLANRDDLRAALAPAPAQPPGEVAQDEDAPLIAAAYRRWGTGMQRYVLGEYCAAVFDLRDRSLTLTHDALGLRPMYYAADPRRFVFASRLDLLLHVRPMRELEDAYIADLLATSMHHGNLTIHRGVRTIGLGHTLRYAEGRVTLVRSWSLSHVAPLRYRDEADYDEQFRRLLREGVTRAACGKTWAELSGGLDSSSVVCAAAEAGVSPLDVISIVYSRSTSADETPWIDHVVRQRRVVRHTIDEDVELPFSRLPDRPLAQPSRICMMWALFLEYEKLVKRNGVDVVLSGYGGDQVLCGDVVHPLYIADDLKRLRLLKVAGELRRWQRAEAQPRPLRHLLFKYALSPIYRQIRGRSLTNERMPRQACTWLHPDFLRRTRPDLVHLPGPPPPTRDVAGQYYFESLWRIGLGAGQFWNQHIDGFDIRYPLLYRPLVEFMHAIPWDQRIRPGGDRVLQRRALRGILPEAVRSRRDKRGPDQAFVAGLRNSAQIMRFLTDKPLIVERGYVHGPTWKGVVAAGRYGVVPSFPCFLMAIVLEIWLRQLEQSGWKLLPPAGQAARTDGVDRRTPHARLHVAEPHAAR